MIKKLLVLLCFFSTTILVQADPYRAIDWNRSFNLPSIPAIKPPKKENTAGYMKTIIKSKNNKFKRCKILH